MNVRRKLGSGGFGTVYYKDENTAEKEIKVGNNEALKVKVLQEIAIMNKVCRSVLTWL